MVLKIAFVDQCSSKSALLGLSDPVVYVECFGQKQCTSVKEKCLSAVWDELLIFNMRNLDKEEVEEVCRGL
jgi:hypothetical protein